MLPFLSRLVRRLEQLLMNVTFDIRKCGYMEKTHITQGAVILQVTHARCYRLMQNYGPRLYSTGLADRWISVCQRSKSSWIVSESTSQPVFREQPHVDKCGVESRRNTQLSKRLIK